MSPNLIKTVHKKWFLKQFPRCVQCRGNHLIIQLTRLLSSFEQNNCYYSWGYLNAPFHPFKMRINSWSRGAWIDYALGGGGAINPSRTRNKLSPGPIIQLYRVNSDTRLVVFLFKVRWVFRLCSEEIELI